MAFVDAFYSSSPREQRPYKLDALSRRKPAIDRRFQERVWTWLTKNPEVSVGKKREGNGLSLSEAEAGQRSPADISDEEITSKALNSQAPASPFQNGSLRVFVSEERTWLAITGHKPDESRVFPTEFALLSIIASRKSEGIVQTDLVKLSGQDKRSVPKRTDRLQQKGYIEKRAVQVKSSRTSLCTLRKFVLDRPAFSTTETPPERGAGTKHQTGDVIDFKVFTDRLFEVLREFKVISRYDLKKILGFADGWRWRILSRALQKFERIGCVQRVRAMSQYDDTRKALHSCVMLTRDPSERDIQFFLDNSRNLFSNLNQEEGTNHELDDDIEADAVRRESSAVHHVRTLEGVKEEVVDGGRILPQWMPDRNLHNLIFDVIDGAGTTGRTNSVSCTGQIFQLKWRLTKGHYRIPCVFALEASSVDLSRMSCVAWSNAGKCPSRRTSDTLRLFETLLLTELSPIMFITRLKILGNWWNLDKLPGKQSNLPQRIRKVQLLLFHLLMPRSCLMHTDYP